MVLKGRSARLDGFVQDVWRLCFSAAFESAGSRYAHSFSWLECALWQLLGRLALVIISIFLSLKSFCSVFSERGVGWLCMYILIVRP